MPVYAYYEYFTRLGWPIAFLLAVIIVCATVRAIFRMKTPVAKSDFTVDPLTWSDTVTKEYAQTPKHHG